MCIFVQSKSMTIPIVLRSLLVYSWVYDDAHTYNMGELTLKVRGIYFIVLWPISVVEIGQVNCIFKLCGTQV